MLGRRHLAQQADAAGLFRAVPTTLSGPTAAWVLPVAVGRTSGGLCVRTRAILPRVFVGWTVRCWPCPVFRAVVRTTCFRTAYVPFLPGFCCTVSSYVQLFQEKNAPHPISAGCCRHPRSARSRCARPRHDCCAYCARRRCRFSPPCGQAGRWHCQRGGGLVAQHPGMGQWGGRAAGRAGGSPGA